MRIGIGYDIHRLMEGRDLVLGGEKIPYIKGLVGYSDADVLLHAVADSILGAASMGDIGVHFPNTDPAYKGASSVNLLKEVKKLVMEKGFSVNNVDVVVMAEEPKIAPFVGKMRKNISDILEIDQTRVSIKATTNEGVGSIGRGEAIASYAAVTLKEG